MNRAALLLLVGLLAGCSPDGPPAPATTSSPGGGATDRGPPRAARAAAPPPVYAAATHAAESAHDAAQGGAVVFGRVLDARGGFEVELRPVGEDGPPPLRVAFGGADGAFRLWPPPGEYLLRVRCGSVVSPPVRVPVAPGERVGPLQVELRPAARHAAG